MGSIQTTFQELMQNERAWNKLLVCSRSPRLDTEAIHDEYGNYANMGRGVIDR
jgi:hypothetical protein